MILLPTRGRPHQLARFIYHYKLTAATLPVLVILDEDNVKAYGDLDLPSHWPFPFINKTIRNLVAGITGAIEAWPNEDFYGVMADDIIPESNGWDVALAMAAGRRCIAWGDDGIQGPRLPTHPFIGGDLVKAWGWFIPPYTKRGYVDFIWKDFADALGIGRYLPEVKTTHYHWHVGKAERDATYACQPSVKGDIDLWQAYRAGSQFQADLERVRKRLGLSPVFQTTAKEVTETAKITADLYFKALVDQEHWQ